MGESKVYNFTTDETSTSTNTAQSNINTATASDTNTNTNTVNLNKDEAEQMVRYEQQVDQSINSTTQFQENTATNGQIPNYNTNPQQQQQQYGEQQQYQQQQYQQQQYGGQQQYQYGQQQQFQNQQQYTDMVPPSKLTVEPVIAALLSCVVIGLGQMINGQLEKGILLLIGSVVAVSIIAVVTCGIGAIIAPIVAVVSALDAYKCAVRLQNGQPIGKYEFHIFD